MPIAYRIDETQGLTVGVWHGNLTEDEIEGATAALLADDRWPPTARKHLTDLTTVAAVPDLLRLAKIHEASGRATGIRLAVVATHAFAEARAYEHAVAAAGLDVIVFNQVATACSWLGVENARAQAMIHELRDELRRESPPR